LKDQAVKSKMHVINTKVGYHTHMSPLFPSFPIKVVSLVKNFFILFVHSFVFLLLSQFSSKQARKDFKICYQLFSCTKQILARTFKITLSREQHALSCYNRHILRIRAIQRFLPKILMLAYLSKASKEKTARLIMDFL